MVRSHQRHPGWRVVIQSKGDAIDHGCGRSAEIDRISHLAREIQFTHIVDRVHKAIFNLPDP